METKLVTMNTDGAWRPSNEQHPETAPAEFRAFLVSVRVVSALGTTFHGKWETAADAKRFARTLIRVPGAVPKVEECEPYWYVPAYGRLES